MTFNLNSFYLRKDTSTASTYYGYNPNLNASESTNDWLILATSSNAGIETMKWSNNEFSYEVDWTNRYAQFISPTSPSMSFVIFTSSLPYYVSITWSAVNGISRYIVDANNGTNSLNYWTDNNLISSRGTITNPYSYSTSHLLKNSTGFKLNDVFIGITYSVTLTTQNAAGSSYSSINIYVQ